MRNVKYFLIIVGYCAAPCFGMREQLELNEATEQFNQEVSNTLADARRQNEHMDTILNVMTFGLYDRFRSGSQQPHRTIETDGPVSLTLSNECQTRRAHSYETPLEFDNEVDCEKRLDDIDEKSEDFSPSSMHFLWQKTQKKPTFFTYALDTFTHRKTRSLLGLIGCSFTCSIGLKSLLNNDENRLFGYSALLAGSTGAFAMVYNLYFE